MSKPQFNRKDPRFPTQLDALVRVVGRFEWKPAVVTNISQGGVGFRCRSSFRKGELVELEISTVDKEGRPRKRRVKGEIAWTERSQYGVKFLPTKIS